MIDNNLRISKYKNHFAKVYAPNWSEGAFVIKEVKNTVPWAYVIYNLNIEEIIETFSEIELQKTNQQKFRIGKVIKSKVINYMFNNGRF